MTINPIALLAENAVKESSFCHCTWKDIALLAASIIGVVASIFAESMLGIVGFVLFGLMTLVNKYANTTRISELEKEIKNTLLEEEHNLSITADKMEEQVHQIELDRDEYKETVAQLERDNEHLRSLQDQFQQLEAKLEEQNKALTKEKDDLTIIVEADKENVRQIRAEVQAIVAEALRFGTTSGLFEQNVESLKATKEQLQQQLSTFNQEFDGNVKSLAQQIQIAKETSKLLAESAAERSKTLEVTIKTLQANVDQRQEVEKQIAKNVATLTQEREQIEARTRELGEKEADLRALERGIQEERAKFQTAIPLERGALQKEIERIQAQQAQMEATAKGLDEMVQLKRELIAELDKKITEKQAQYLKLKADVRGAGG